MLYSPKNRIHHRVIFPVSSYYLHPCNTKILFSSLACPSWFIFDILSLKLWRPRWFAHANFFKIRLSSFPHFFFISKTSNSSFVHSRSFGGTLLSSRTFHINILESYMGETGKTWKKLNIGTSYWLSLRACTLSYGPSFFPPSIYEPCEGSSGKHLGHTM